MVFLKLGGSLLTDKTTPETIRADVLSRVAAEIAAGRPETLLLGHGSGSFGHLHGSRHGTRSGVQTAAQWRGFVDVSDAALRLNRLVVRALLDVGITAMSISPSASAAVIDGQVTSIATGPIRAALNHGVLPVVHGDVAFDEKRGGTILSTEEVFAALLAEFRPSWLLLAGETDGVYDQRGETVPLITTDNFDDFAAALGGSRGFDVTGGMAGKVRDMLALVEAHPGLRIRIFSALTAGMLQAVLEDPSRPVGTEIR
ncbi:MAG: isopentenyl phosphate kinase [Ardenticatenaceae bacterium]|nr:isopentenyl phosphate kinase [Ardenticatenaceae bacterium]